MRHSEKRNVHGAAVESIQTDCVGSTELSVRSIQPGWSGCSVNRVTYRGALLPFRRCHGIFLSTRSNVSSSSSSSSSLILLNVIFIGSQLARPWGGAETSHDDVTFHEIVRQLLVLPNDVITRDDVGESARWLVRDVAPLAVQQRDLLHSHMGQRN
jgi:hypothetical protein